MKKIALALILLTVATLLSCSFDLSAGKRPTDQLNTRWVSTDPDIYFEVSDKYEDITGSWTYGQINIDGVITEIMVGFDYILYSKHCR
jgi:hypothetical protein